MENDKAEILRETIVNLEHLFLENKREELHKHILEIVERPLIEMVLAKTDGNQKKAAKLLGINRNTLHAKIKKLGIDAKKFKIAY
ncbi:MAG: helix-turn-helix domain-containing protein [Candidatus Omnitrophica bacterium]|jgi:two component, sigma54 specific, transcriptional regulator, Fis family|nr:helix-turn-helix domain-containing protein [Candidatus Omnitrophota bacterium]